MQPLEAVDVGFTGTMHRACMHCGASLGTKPCVPQMDGMTSHGICPRCLGVHYGHLIDSQPGTGRACVPLELARTVELNASAQAGSKSASMSLDGIVPSDSGERGAKTARTETALRAETISAVDSSANRERSAAKRRAEAVDGGAFSYDVQPDDRMLADFDARDRRGGNGC